MAGNGQPKIGVLALQGDFEAHHRALERAGAQASEVRTAGDLDMLDGLVIPGGESSTMLKLILDEQLLEPLRQFGTSKPIFGTCAGAILLATEVMNPAQQSLGLVDMSIERNAYGRQIDSRISSIEVNGKPREAVFIRAPIIRRVGPEVKVLASYQNQPVLIEQGKHLVATFHPELTADVGIHRHFVESAKGTAACHQTRKEPARFSGGTRDTVSVLREFSEKAAAESNT
ncbi:MAG TPA: pyridoxal 5'-phosphate synthase glutaminase subunit PdxT [Bryobacteraceae bacterium]|nr:pyridoxal 5'-phosphate synthase glutaminase subunit PdxT [Bryobacteraceae bacterium]